MKFSLSWLKDHLETNCTPNHIGEVLTDMGLEIESLVNPKDLLEGLSVGKIIEIRKHPNADKLNICQVQTSDDDLNIICGATNIKVGMKVVVAKPGSFIPGLNIALKKSNIRGVESFGMMCSEKELNISDEHEGIIELPQETEVGVPYSSIIDENTVTFEIAITPNRPDALSVFGIARDLAARGVGKLKIKDSPKIKETFISTLSIQLDSSVVENECPFFVARHIKNVKNSSSPNWLQKRLKSIGLKPISALVDITNYMTFDKGRPLHVFDADKINGNLRVRKSFSGEEFHALDEIIYKLEEGMTVIVDEKEIVSLAGIIGGLNSSVSELTNNVILESAYFEPISVASTGRKLKINSDARYRFERGVDPSFTIRGSDMATRMILEICGGEASNSIVSGKVPELNREILFNPQKVTNLLGIDIKSEKQISILVSLGFDVRENKGELLVGVPPWRPDVHGQADLVEEIARISSLANLPSTPMYRDTPDILKPVVTIKQSRESMIKRTLASLGYTECLSYSFLDEYVSKTFNDGNEEILLLNPISSEMTNMRNSLLPGLIRVIEKNQAKGTFSMALFELGQCFKSNRVGDEDSELTAILLGNSSDQNLYNDTRPLDIFDIKRDLQHLFKCLGLKIDGFKMHREAPDFFHPQRSASLFLGNKKVAVFGEISPFVLKDFSIKGRVNSFTVFLENLTFPKQKKISKNPLLVENLQAIERDFSFLVNVQEEFGNLRKAILSLKNEMIVGVTIFDTFIGSNLNLSERKSMSIRVKIQPKTVNLNDGEIGAICKEIIDVVSSKVGGTLRS